MIKRFVLALAIALVAGQAYATCVGTRKTASIVETVCDGGSGSTEVDPQGVGTSANPVGMALDGVTSVDVQVCADFGDTVTDITGKLAVWFYDDGKWALSDMSLQGGTGKECVYARFDSPGTKGNPIVQGRGRIYINPVGATYGGSHLTIKIISPYRRGD